MLSSSLVYDLLLWILYTPSLLAPVHLDCLAVPDGVSGLG